MARKPSHLGSYTHPWPVGSVRAVLASWGRTGGERGSATAGDATQWARTTRPARTGGASGEGAGEAGLLDRRALVEAGPGLGTVLRRESVDRAQDGHRGRDGEERDHVHQYRTK